MHRDSLPARRRFTGLAGSGDSLALARLAAHEKPTALVRLCPPAYIAGRTFLINAGEKLAPDKLREQLVVAGYQHVTQVVAPGAFCFRGGLIDLFPTGGA